MKFSNTIPITKNTGFNYNEYSFHKFNEIGSQNAYNSHNKIYIDDDNMFIAGTSSLRDVVQDWVKIPLHLTSKTQRYQDAEKVLQHNPQITNLYGHSLGSSVAFELEKNRPDLTVWAAYATPTISGTKSRSNNRFKHPYDPFASLDSGAEIHPNKQGYDQHTYKNY